MSGRGVETCPLPRYLPGLAWTCWDLPCNEVTLFTRSHCQQIGSWISIFTRGCSVWVGSGAGRRILVAPRMERGPPQPLGWRLSSRPLAHCAGGVAGNAVQAIRRG